MLYVRVMMGRMQESNIKTSFKYGGRSVRVALGPHARYDTIRYDAIRHDILTR